MPSPQVELLSSVKSLPVPERLAMIRELAASLETEDSFWLSDEWAVTLDRRSAELDAADPSRRVPWADVEHRLAERIRRHVDG
jgi:putative addiction module component (TIGR02574 family)